MSQPNRKSNRKKHCCYQHDKEGLETNLPEPSCALKPDSCASCVSHVVPSNMQIKSSSEQLAVKLSISNSYISSKAVPSSSPQKPDTDSLVQSDAKLSASSSHPSKSVSSPSAQKTNTVKSVVKLSNSKSYLPTKIVPSSSPPKPYVVSFPNAFTSKPGIMPSHQWVVKSKASAINLASIPIPADSPTPKAVSSPVCTAKETITAPFGPSDAESKVSKISQCSKVESNSVRIHPTKNVSETSDSSRLCNPSVMVVSGCTQNKPPLEKSEVKVQDSTSSFPSKDVSSSSLQRVDTESSVKLDLKSNTLKNSLPTETVSSSNTPLKPHAASLPDKSLRISPSRQWVVKSNVHISSMVSEHTEVMSPTPKSFTCPICTKKETITFASPKAGPCQNESGDSELNDSTNSALSNSGPSQSEIEFLTEVEMGGTQRYDIPKHIRKMLRNDKVPPAVLRMPLSPGTYVKYFATLLYAEDIYCQKWSKFLLKDVSIELQNRGGQSNKKKSTRDLDLNLPYVAFEIDKVRERRPFLLSRDYVHLRPSGQGKDVEALNGILYRIKNGRTILAKFEDDFHSQHKSSTKYDVSFSFNRVCLKRAHRAVSAAAKPLLSRILFPSVPTSLLPDCDRVSPTNQILNHKLAPIPYLIEGPGHSADMLILIKDTILQIYKSNNESRVLVCASKNSTCDALVRSIMKTVPRSELFRANAAFRDKKEVPDDIMQVCRYYEKCFTIPPVNVLENFRIISSTFVNTFGLYKAGLKAGHFSHIFLVDAASVMEPEVIVALTDLVIEETVIVVSGSVKHKPQWIRSNIGRNHGLRESFFSRLLESEPYRFGNPLFITRIKAL